MVISGERILGEEVLAWSLGDVHTICNLNSVYAISSTAKAGLHTGHPK